MFLVFYEQEVCVPLCQRGMVLLSCTSISSCGGNGKQVCRFRPCRSLHKWLHVAYLYPPSSGGWISVLSTVVRLLSVQQCHFNMSFSFFVFFRRIAYIGSRVKCLCIDNAKVINSWKTAVFFFLFCIVGWELLQGYRHLPSYLERSGKNGGRRLVVHF